MKPKAFFRTLSLTVLTLVGIGISSASASDQFRIVRVSQVESSDAIYVNRIAREDLPKRIKVTLRTTSPMSANGVRVKAYFYDKDKNLLHEAKTPNGVWIQGPKGFGWYEAPKEYKSNSADVYFAISDQLIDKKWKSVVVVFGKGDDVVARSFPKDAAATHDYPEAKLANKD